MVESFDPQEVQDIASARKALVQLLNLVEELKQDVLRLREENQRLRDENNRLKGEQGKPSIKASKKEGDISSEKERKQGKKPRQRHKRKKLSEVKIDREEYLDVDKASLPKDVTFKGYDPVIIQDLRIETDNIRFQRARHYSASARKNYTAALPPGYHGQFGPTIRSLAISLYYAANISEPKIIELLEQMGVNISKGKVSDLLSKETLLWQRESDAVKKAGLQSSKAHHLDDTPTRVNGVNGFGRSRSSRSALT